MTDIDERAEKAVRLNVPTTPDVAEGRTNQAIADSLFITGGAVEKHVKSIFGKLGLGQGDADHLRVRAVLVYLHGQ